MDSSNQGKVAVITGATGGIGSAIARSLSREGYSLVLTAPSMEMLTGLASELDGPCSVVAANLADECIAKTLLRTALDRFGRCDVCFNNGGLLEAGTIEAVEIDRICNMVRVNVEGAFRIAYVFLQHFVQQGYGHLVNTSSLLVGRVRPTVGAYAATKYAIEAFSQALGMELSKTDVQISCIEPEQVRTVLHGRWEVPPVEALGISDPMEPDDVARMVMYILDPPAHLPFASEMLMAQEQLV